MRAVLQRVTRAEVRVESEVAGSESETVGSIDEGLLVLVGVTDGDTEIDAKVLAKKIVGMRVFRDEEMRMNRSVADVGGSVLIVSQFTLYADVRKGRRPSFASAADPELAQPLIELLTEEVGRYVRVASGSFGAMMEVDLVNDGPVTIMIEVEGGRVV